ncbi:beta-mannosidase [Brevundimonas lenta]|uniref:Beta-mannosidase B n=1 Tax=Brevundimonas lenta TaxID=424796 RepID=A0A7W6JD77_9CAUL|nr:glycoside hydrolase family 2 protein [Brevundimonas lenta]MBB4081991.1 beta-mannosidase [Brevundimonas lenta]
MIELDRWELRDFAPGEGSAHDEGEAWLPVSAPGDTYVALIAAGRLQHPFDGRGEDEAAWVRDREWWWRTTFEAPAHAATETVELVFEGLDTFATIYLDGELIGRTDNMFRRYAFDVRDRLKPGARHALAVRFDPPARAVEARPLPVWSAFTDRVSRSQRNLMRKAQFGWGWDWGPDLPTVGVWQPVRLNVRPRARIAGAHYINLVVSAEHAGGQIEVELENPAADASIEITLTDPHGAVVFRREAPAADRILTPVDIHDPQLWWTADLGDQPLYALAVRLIANGRTVDETRRAIGLRTVHLDQSPDPDEPGATFFRFVLNGVPIFAKGACWVPSTSFVAEPDAEAYERLLDQAVRANMNMIRVWGGGIYEPDLFYDLCDRRGLLVWQDFMFACAHYPEDDAFAASVGAEIEDQVRRLRHHPSLALWCGNNESQAMHRINNDKSGEDGLLSGTRLYDELMPAWLKRLDPETPYWPGSPWGGPNPNSMRAGDVHDWTVWHGVPPIPDAEMIEPFQSSPEGVAYTRYAEDTARFVSEFGIQAAPALATLKRWMDPADLTLDSPGFLARIKDEARKADALMTPVTGLPTTLEQYVDFTQWTQAEGLKFGIEHFRRRRPHCSGALLWQFNDCWPCVSWSLVDYDGVEKASFHAVRRAFAPVLASFRAAHDGTVELWITNDTLEPVEGEAVVTLEDFDGRIIQRWTAMFSAAGGGHALPWREPLSGSADQVLRVRSPDHAFETARHLFRPIADLALRPDARPRVAITQPSETELRIDLAAGTWLAFVHIISDRPDLRFSDNYFDLAAGEERTVVVTAATPLSAADIAVRCWNETLAEGPPAG